MPTRILLCLLGVAALAACTRPHVQTTESYLGPSLPRPDHVLVSYFSVTPEQVRLDQGIGARIVRRVDDQPPGADEMRAAQATQVAMTEELVRRLRGYGLPAEIASMQTPPGTSLLVQGQIVGIDQGNRTRRILIGLGAGKSTVSADAQLYYATDTIGAPRFLSAFEGEADSGRMPGAAETMGAGAVAQRAATSAAVSGVTHAGAESRKTSDTSEAGRLADGLARQIGQFAATQGWIEASAVR